VLDKFRCPDPSLDKYIKTNGKTALVTLPPL
jgi:hypothetical protein